MRILKYPFDDTETTIELPSGASPISVGIQEGKIVVWAEVPHPRNDEQRKVEVFFVFTGADKPEPGAFIGTVQRWNHNLVQHFYWRYKNWRVTHSARATRHVACTPNGQRCIHTTRCVAHLRSSRRERLDG